MRITRIRLPKIGLRNWGYAQNTDLTSEMEDLAAKYKDITKIRYWYATGERYGQGCVAVKRNKIWGVASLVRNRTCGVASLVRDGDTVNMDSVYELMEASLFSDTFLFVGLELEDIYDRADQETQEKLSYLLTRR